MIALVTATQPSVRLRQMRRVLPFATPLCVSFAMSLGLSGSTAAQVPIALTVGRTAGQPLSAFGEAYAPSAGVALGAVITNRRIAVGIYLREHRMVCVALACEDDVELSSGVFSMIGRYRPTGSTGRVSPWVEAGIAVAGLKQSGTSALWESLAWESRRALGGEAAVGVDLRIGGSAWIGPYARLEFLRSRLIGTRASSIHHRNFDLTVGEGNRNGQAVGVGLLTLGLRVTFGPFGMVSGRRRLS